MKFLLLTVFLFPLLALFSVFFVVVIYFFLPLRIIFILDNSWCNWVIFIGFQSFFRFLAIFILWQLFAILAVMFLKFRFSFFFMVVSY